MKRMTTEQEQSFSSMHYCAVHRGTSSLDTCSQRSQISHGCVGYSPSQ